MWLGVRNDATHDMGDRPLPSTYKSAWPHTVGQDMMSSSDIRIRVGEMSLTQRQDATVHGGPERAIVSGATSGIGRAVAVRLARRGAVVGILGRNEAAASEVARE